MDYRRSANFLEAVSELTGAAAPAIVGAAGGSERDRGGDSNAPLTRLGTSGVPTFVGRWIRRRRAKAGVARPTSFRWRQRSLALPAQRQAPLLSGIAEVDEILFRHSQNGADRLQRKARKPGGMATKPGRSDERAGVLVARSRSGTTVDALLQRVNQRMVQAVLASVLQSDALLCSDGDSAYRAFAAHGVVPGLPDGVRVFVE